MGKEGGKTLVGGKGRSKKILAQHLLFVAVQLPGGHPFLGLCPKKKAGRTITEKKTWKGRDRKTRGREKRSIPGSVYWFDLKKTVLVNREGVGQSKKAYGSEQRRQKGEPD